MIMMTIWMKMNMMMVNLRIHSGPLKMIKGVVVDGNGDEYNVGQLGW